MATTEELLKRKKELSAKIAAAAKVDITATTARKRMASLEATKKYRAELASINDQLAGKPKTPPKKEFITPKPSGPTLASNAPVGIGDDLAADLAAAGYAINDSAIWQQGGVGSTALVYLGETTKTGTGLVFKNGKPMSSVTPTLKPATTITTDFWNDKALQNKIIGAYASKGKAISTVEAYGLWSQLVTTAATIYQGGRGPKVTPLMLLNDSLKSVKGDEPALPTRAISQLDKAKSFEALDTWGLGKIGRKLDDAEKQDLFNILSKANTGSVTTYKKTKNVKTGKMENVQITTPGLTSEASEAIVEKKLKAENPEEYERRKAFEFSNDLNRLMSGGM